MPESPRPAGDTSRWAVVAERIEGLARKDFPSTFAGIALEGSGIALYRVPTPGNPLDAAVEDEYPTAPVTFKDARRTAAELQNLTNRVVSDMNQYWPANGVTITEVGPNAASGTVEIYTTEAAETVQSKLTDRYGSMVAVHGNASMACPL